MNNILRTHLGQSALDENLERLVAERETRVRSQLIGNSFDLPLDVGAGYLFDPENGAETHSK